MTDSALLDSRYRVLRTIGSGGMGVVYLVIDTSKENKIIALKTCAGHCEAATAEGFRAEFRNILGVRHPHIPEVYDFGTLKVPQESLYFTCEFIDGQPLDSLQDSWSPAQLRTVLVSLSRALAFLHSRGLLHRDIKPDNVLGKLDPNGNFLLLKLVDFGLASTAATEINEVGGTLDYLAPEVMQGEPPSEAADLYSLGLLLFRLAAGTLPFADEDAVAAARHRTRSEIPSVLRYRADFPVGFADVIGALTRPKPADRPASARHVIALLNEREGLEIPYETPETSHAYIQSGATVTNANARHLLHIKKEAIRHDVRLDNVLVQSRPGLGRGRLFQDYVNELTLTGISNRVTRTPADLPSTEHCPRALIVPDIDAFGVEAWREALTRYASVSPWWLAGCSRIPAELLNELENFRIVTLQPLSEDGVRGFVDATLPGNSFPDSFRRRLHSETLGIPSALHSALSDLQQRELIRIGLAGWELMPGDWDLPVHENVRDTVLAEAALLPAEAREALQLITCSLTPLPKAVLLDAVQEQGDGIPEPTIAFSKWIEANDDTLQLRFEAVRQVLGSAVPEEQARDYHLRLRAAWERHQSADVDLRERECLYHDFKGQSWQTPPADAERVLQNAILENNLTWAHELLLWSQRNHPAEKLKPVIWTLLSRIEYIEGNFSHSAELLGELLDGGKAKVTSANLVLMARFASLEEKLGRTERAEKILEEGLRLLTPDRNEVAGAIFGTLAWIAFKRGEQDRARKLAEDGLSRIPADAVDPGFLLLLNTFATLAFYRGDSEVAALYWQRGLEVSKALNDRKTIANMYNNLGVLAATTGDRIRARNLWEQCAEIARQINDTHRLAGIYNNLGIDALETGAMREAEEYYLKALTLFRRMQSPREQVEILSNLGELSFYRADYPRAQAYFREAVDLAVQLGDRESQVEPMVYLGKLLITLDHVEQAETILNDAQLISHEIGVRKGEGQAWEGLAQIYARKGLSESVDTALKTAHELLQSDSDPLAAIHLNLTECQIAADRGDRETAASALNSARQVADIKWDPFTAARTEVFGLLFADEELDDKRRRLALRKLNVFPNFLWEFHWADARHQAKKGALKKALEEFGRGVAVLKAITARLSESDRERFLNSPAVKRFKAEALEARQALGT